MWPGRLGYENFWSVGAGGGMPHRPVANPIAVNANLSGAAPTLSSMPAYQPRSPGSVGPGRGAATSVMVEAPRNIKNALRNGAGPMRAAPFGRPGLLMTAIGAGTAGAVMGNGDFTSFAAGAGAGIIGGHVAEAGAAAVYKGLTAYGRKNAGKMSESAFKAVTMGRTMTSAGGRGMIFGAGALLAGGLFGRMFTSDKRDYSRGLNAQRGNGF